MNVRTNEELVTAVRAARPDAWLVYKEHPEIVAGNRPGRLSPEVLLNVVDEYVQTGSILDEIQRSDEIHVITSLAGFEALIRGKHVVCWGAPFYAGWGLTEDRIPHPRRTRQLSLDQLVAGALIRYPRYVEPIFGLACDAADVVRLLQAAQPAQGRPKLLNSAPVKPFMNAWRFLKLWTGFDARRYWLPR